MAQAITVIQNVVQEPPHAKCDAYLAETISHMVRLPLITALRNGQEEIGIIVSDRLEARLAKRIDDYINDLFNMIIEKRMEKEDEDCKETCEKEKEVAM